MENKYYTPELEEFHEGFIYESNWDNNGVWKKEIFDGNHGICDLGEHLNVFRVKYLDKEDIESSGWKYTGKIDFINKNDPELHLQITCSEPSQVRIYKPSHMKGYFKKELVSWIKIKNKSELHKLMKQIGI